MVFITFSLFAEPSQFCWRRPERSLGQSSDRPCGFAADRLGATTDAAKPGRWHPRDMERLALIGRLKPGTEAQAAKLIANGPPFDLEAHKFERHTVYLSPGEVVFVFEGHEVEWLVDEMVDDPFEWPLSDALAHWSPLLDGTPQMARELYFWERAPVAAQ
jgi:hypothetical protein